MERSGLTLLHLLILLDLSSATKAMASGNRTCGIGRTCAADSGHLLLQLHAGSSGNIGAKFMEGHMTMWSDSNAVVVGGSCEYANAANGGIGSPAATSPYLSRMFYCAADAALFADGANCGGCFRVTYDGSDATDEGRPGDAVVQIVNSGSSEAFDCHVEAFETITGARTGVFPISYEPVDCETADGGAVVTVLDGDNAWYTKVIFSNLPGAVLGAEIIVDGTVYTMERAGGAVWKSQLTGLMGLGVLCKDSWWLRGVP